MEAGGIFLHQSLAAIQFLHDGRPPCQGVETMHRLPHGAARASSHSVQAEEAGGRNPYQNIEEENRANEKFNGAYQGHGIRSTHGGLNSQARRQDRRESLQI
jgi:hypothetical protein